LPLPEGAGTVGLIGGYSRTREHYSTLFRDGQNNVAQSYVEATFCTLATSFVEPLASFTREYSFFFNKLPLNYDEASYFNVLSQFGTHLVSKVPFGLKINVSTIFKKDILNIHNTSWVNEQVGLSLEVDAQMLNFSFGLSHGTKVNSSVISKDFSSISHPETTIVPGNSVIDLKNSGFDAWYKKISNKGILGALSEYMILTPLHVLLEDKRKRDNMFKAIVQYVNKARQTTRKLN